MMINLFISFKVSCWTCHIYQVTNKLSNLKPLSLISKEQLNHSNQQHCCNWPYPYFISLLFNDSVTWLLLLNTKKLTDLELAFILHVSVLMFDAANAIAIILLLYLFVSHEFPKALFKSGTGELNQFALSLTPSLTHIDPEQLDMSCKL